MSYDVKPLQTQGLRATVPAMGDVAERARLRLREEMTRRHLSQQDVADLIQWTQSRVAQKLTGRTPITLEELEALAFAVGLPMTELVRDHGLEFCADMTPTEMRILQAYRQLPEKYRAAVQDILFFATKTVIQERHAAPKKAIVGRGRAR